MTDNGDMEMAVGILDDRALEALRSGTRPAQGGFDWLVPFVEDLMEVATGPAPVPRPELALLLDEGSSGAPDTLPVAIDDGTPSGPRTGSARRRGTRRRLTGVGVAAKAGVALLLAAAATTAAGAAGVLPDPAQRVVATVIEAVTPFTIPEPADDRPGSGAPGGAEEGEPSDTGRHGDPGGPPAGGQADNPGNSPGNSPGAPPAAGPADNPGNSPGNSPGAPPGGGQANNPGNNPGGPPGGGQANNPGNSPGNNPGGPPGGGQANNPGNNPANNNPANNAGGPPGGGQANNPGNSPGNSPGAPPGGGPPSNNPGRP